MRRARTPEDKERRRQLLLQAALIEFYEKGYSAARMDDIAKRADLTKGTLYLYYESKEVLFKALIQSLVEPTLARVQMITSQSHSLESAMQGMALFMPQVLRESHMPKLMKVLIGDSHTFPRIIHDYRTEVLEHLLGAFAQMLEREMDHGEVIRCDPKLAARLIVAPVVMQGVWQALFAKDPEAQVDIDQLFQLHAHNTLRALRPQQQP